MRRIFQKIIGKNPEGQTLLISIVEDSPKKPPQKIYSIAEEVTKEEEAESLAPFMHFVRCPECSLPLHPPTYEVCRGCGWVMLD